MNKDILICGVGGQGTVLASKIIAAAAMNEGNKVHSAETIGMAQRGGSVTSHVRIGDGAFSPLIPAKGADMIIAFEPAEAVRNLPYLKNGGTVIVNKSAVIPTTASLLQAMHQKVSPYDGTEMLSYLSRKCNTIIVDGDEICSKLGSVKFLNVAILGASVGSGSLGITEEAIISEIKSRVKEKFIEKNLQAFALGKSCS